MDATLTKSEIFSWYNRARACGKLEAKRTNKALGYLLRKDQSWRAKYNPTTHSCGCKDRRLNPEQACKHMQAKMIETRIFQNRPTPPVLVNPETLVENAPYMETSDGTIITAEISKGGYTIHEFDTLEAAKAWGSFHKVARPGRIGGRRFPDVRH